MNQKPAACAGCPIESIGQGFVPPFGTGSNRVGLVGMAPAKQEIERGEPFVGRAGTVLSKILRKVGAREEFDIRNVLQCRGPNDELSWEGVGDAIAHCAVHRDRYERRPAVRVALGAMPFRVTTGSDVPISKARGYRFETPEGPVIPTFHPSFVGRGNMNLIPVVAWDLLTALKERDLPPPSWPMDDLTLYPTPADFADWAHQASRSSFLAFDLETIDSAGDEEELEVSSYQLTRFSLATDDFRAITAPWQEPFVGMLRELMAAEMPKVGWNSQDFDLPRLREVGIRPAGRLIDAMWLWNFLQKTLPRGLGAVTTFYDRVPAWKHLSGTDEELYAAMDARETAKNFVGIRAALSGRCV